MIAGAGAAYLNGGFGIWEFVFTAIVTFCAYRGLRSYRFIGVGWLLHTGWVVMQFESGTRILRVIHGRDARATSPNCITTYRLGHLASSLRKLHRSFCSYLVIRMRDL
jgi:hypothetical protein